MTFEEILGSHESEKPLSFTHPDIKGAFCFDGDGCMSFRDQNGELTLLPLWLSDFDRDDWEIVQGCTFSKAY